MAGVLVAALVVAGIVVCVVIFARRKSQHHYPRSCKCTAKLYNCTYLKQCIVLFITYVCMCRTFFLCFVGHSCLLHTVLCRMSLSLLCLLHTVLCRMSLSLLCLLHTVLCRMSLSLLCLLHTVLCRTFLSVLCSVCYILCFAGGCERDSCLWSLNNHPCSAVL